MNRPVIVLGAGGHAAVVIDVLRSNGAEILGCAAPGQSSTLPAGVAYLGTDEAVLARRPGDLLLAVGVGSVGKPEIRRRVFGAFQEKGYRFATLVHPAAVVAADVELGEGAQIMAGAVLQPGCRVGENAIVNTGAVVDHHGRLGRHAHIAPGAVLGGGVTVGHAAHIGAGATVLQGITIGAESVVGAGAVVVRDLPAGVTATGVPARIVKR